MKTALATTALLASACTASPRVEPTPPPIAAVSACAVTVTFGSYAMGIDRETFAAIDTLLERDKGVTATLHRRWGREGEMTVCVATRSTADRTRLFGKIGGLFPATPRGPLTVETADGRRFEAGATP